MIKKKRIVTDLNLSTDFLSITSNIGDTIFKMKPLLGDKKGN